MCTSNQQSHYEWISVSYFPNKYVDKCSKPKQSVVTYSNFQGQNNHKYLAILITLSCNLLNFITFLDKFHYSNHHVHLIPQHDPPLRKFPLTFCCSIFSQLSGRFMRFIQMIRPRSYRIYVNYNQEIRCHSFQSLNILIYKFKNNRSTK